MYRNIFQWQLVRIMLRYCIILYSQLSWKRSLEKYDMYTKPLKWNQTQLLIKIYSIYIIVTYSISPVKYFASLFLYLVIIWNTPKTIFFFHILEIKCMKKWKKCMKKRISRKATANKHSSPQLKSRGKRHNICLLIK